MSLASGMRLGPYEVVAPLGRGGMGEVYRARDTRLGRDVAIKILPPHLASDSESIRRFEKEARAVASLSHPNVVTLLDVGEQEGIRFAVSELVAGETLRARLAAGPLPPREAAEIAAQISDGLAAAHEAGVVHRDIKPENVVMTPRGLARILDFGLAKRGGPAGGANVGEDEPTRSELITDAGLVAGTVGYMSPEQVRGEPVDGRSDVFSLGVVLWEMLTGRRPFSRDSHVETMNAILKEAPQPQLALDGLPPEIANIVRRCLEKRRENRYHSAVDLAHDLRASSSATISRPDVSAVRAHPRARKELWLAAAAAIAAIAAVVVFLSVKPFRAPASRLPRTFAVLPFRAIGDPVGEHFGLGIADSLIGRLAGIRQLTVRPTSAIARYETSPAPAGEVGQALDVEAVLEGTYQKLEGLTRVSVQMTDVQRQALLWSDHIDLPEGRLFELQDAISRRIVEKLEVELDPEAKEGLEKSQPVPDSVMERYLAARALLPGSATSMLARRQEIVKTFDRIVEEHPTFARAVGARAYARAWLTFVQPTEENYRAALTDAERAIALDPDLAEPRVAKASLAWSSLGGWNVPTAVRELTTAISLAPNLEIAHADLSRIAYHNGWREEASRALDEARRLNPTGDVLIVAAAMISWLDDPKKALELFAGLPAAHREAWLTRWQAMAIRAAYEDPKRLLPELEALQRQAPPSDPIFPTVLAIARARAGLPTADIEERLARFDPRVGHFHHVLHFLADVHAVRGDTLGAIELLRQAVRAGFPCAPCYDNDRLLDPLRRTKEYAALREEIVAIAAANRQAVKDVLPPVR